MAEAAARRRRWLLPAALVVTLLCWSPLLSVLAAGWVAERAGCALHEGFANPCVIGGVDRGPTLYGMFVMGWFGVVTVPFAFFATLALAGRAAWRLDSAALRR